MEKNVDLIFLPQNKSYNIFILTVFQSQKNCELRIILKFEGQTYYAQYSTFKLAGSAQDYQLTIGGYSGTAGDALLDMGQDSPNGLPFSTFDRDNDNSKRNCAKFLRTGWWMNNCTKANLNGVWNGTQKGGGVMWFPLTGYDKSVEYTEMKVRTRPNVNINLKRLRTTAFDVHGELTLRKIAI